jgi:hypothetical protein
MDFRETGYLRLPWKLGDKIQIWLKSDENISPFKWRPERLYIVDSDIKSLKKAKINTLLHLHNSAYMATMFNSKIQRTHSCQSPVLFIQYGSTIKRMFTIFTSIMGWDFALCSKCIHAVFTLFCIYCVCLSRVLLVLPLFVYLIW